MVFVFDLSFRQRSAIVQAPVDRFQAFVNIPLVEEVDERPGNDRLIGGFHSQIRVIPAAENTQPFEIFPLQSDPLFGVLAANAADLRRRHLRLLRAKFLIDFMFDRQPVAIPARHIWRVVTRHCS